MKIFKRKQTPCMDKDFCSECGTRSKEQSCELCRSYKPIDSALGWCIFNPEPLVVAWCRDICGQFKCRGGTQQ